MRDGFTFDYAASRESFLARREAGGLVGREWALDGHRGPAGERLTTDTALLGDTRADRLIVVISGTHGVEGFCGGGVQGDLLARPPALPEDVAILLVHALNPFGFAHLRRTDADNVDLNRNFLDHRASRPANPAYDEIHDWLVPEYWEGPVRAAADAALQAYARERGERALQAAVSGGQWDHPDGLFYGGAAPSWSRETWLDILHVHARDARLVAVVDFHTGLGERGACELISGAVADSDEHTLAQRWFGDDIVFPGISSTAPAAKGFMGSSLATALPQARGAFVVAEFGTVAFDEILRVLRADNWLHARGEVESALGRQIKEDMRAAFHGDEAWQDAILTRSRDLIARTVAAMADTPLSKDGIA